MTNKISAKDLHNYIYAIYLKIGISEEEAYIIASLSVQTNLWGIDSHGVLRTPIYAKRLMDGVVNTTPQILTIKDQEGPIALLDADNGMGYIAAHTAMKLAIKKAKLTGIGYVTINNSNHCGAMGLYIDMANKEGMMSIATTNVVPNIGMPGNLKPVTGNNPIAFGAPLSGDHNFILDISLSEVAGGKLLLAAKKGEKIPTTWAIDINGNMTDDPTLGFNGILLPVGMHKGFGMSLFVDILTGVLSGGPFLQDLKGMYKQPDAPSKTTHVMIVIDPTFFMSQKEFTNKMDVWVDMIKKTPMKDSSQTQLIPGEIESNKLKQKKVTGIELPAELIADFEELEKKLSLNLSIKELLQ